MQIKAKAAGLIVLGTFAFSLPTCAQDENEISCPFELRHYIAVDMAEGWELGGPEKSSNLETASVMAGMPGEEENDAPADLAPSREEFQTGRIIQTWEFDRETDPDLILVCRYEGSKNYLRRALPASVTHCVKELSRDQNTRTLAMNCRE